MSAENFTISYQPIGSRFSNIWIKMLIFRQLLAGVFNRYPL